MIKPAETDQVAITMDWPATILEATGTPQDPNFPFDGLNLLPLMKKEVPDFDRKLFWRMKDQDAVRKGKWKYYRKVSTLKECTVEDEYLFDLLYDQHEQTNFKEEFPEVFQELKADFIAWNKEMLPYPK